MSFLKSKAFWAKALGWVAGALGMFAASDPASPYANMARDAAPLIGGWAIHLASQTSQPALPPKQ